MKTNYLVAVTIPIYKVKPDKLEIMSLEQCLKVLGKHPIIFFCPEGMDVTFYLNFCRDRANITFETFEPSYFKDIKGYNKLMLSKGFYKRFISFKYILIYQLDAFVFKDELQYWCEQGYDFIGAPYAFVNMDTYPIKVLTKYRALLKMSKRIFPFFYTFKQVGNGGFSLRNIKKTIWLLNFKKLQEHKWTVLMEDNFFQYWGNIMFPFFKLPKVEQAAKFSIEIDTKKTFILAGSQLPFGCHAFRKYEPDFWAPYFEELGYNIKE